MMRNLILSLTAAAIFLAGCTVADPETANARKIAAYLDQDAMEYRIITDRAWQITFDRAEKSFFNGIRESRDSGKDVTQLLRGYLFTRMCLALLGINDSPGCGYSSKAIDPAYIHNRFFLAAPADEPLLAEKFFARDSIIPAEFIRTLPAGTILAATADIHPEALLDAIGKTGDFANILAEKVPAVIPVRDLAAGTAGRWSFTALRCDGYAMRLQLPDKEGKIFKLLHFIAMSNRRRDGVAAFDSKVMIPGLGVVVKGENALTVYSSEKAEKDFNNSEFITIPPECAGLTARMPEKASAVLFADIPLQEPTKFRLLGHNFTILSMPQIPAMATLSRNSDGLLFLSNCDTPVLTEQLSILLGLTGRLAGIPQAKPQAQPAKKAPAPSVKKRVTASENCICAEYLTTALETLKKNPDLKPGFYTALADTLYPGKAAHSQFEVAYFGKIPSQIPTVLFITKPHQGSFCAAFADGKIGRFTLKNPAGFRRMISFLQSIRNYDEKVFRQMIIRADEFDRAIKGEKNHE
ncbi:MAG: hypothetical protein IKC82_04435 [Lentisphaeria bacterium]|nr:hypothetical protein [Lentisphaeria bacterium]